jgi:ABC-type cobalt transport system substrate-binding protein
MSVLKRHPGRAASLALAAVGITALAFNGPVAAGESAGASNEATAVVSEVAGDLAPMIEPVEDVDESDASGDLAPMIEPMEDVDESDASGDLAPMIEPMEDVDE